MGLLGAYDETAKVSRDQRQEKTLVLALEG
jgi:hypothetical protein